ncbi:alpha-taxilin-like isoform X1 [Sphaeramia orbicularis]|uniref:alpha-taxilin-like isoform X1 n=1 Tax=Sphaeramia orbicularis TaxID=375764 RepID=UPI00118160B9|nr:alpha-taxilin-like isoform X1 [Sphaeramia orbicularis]XP_029985363.1 alpha-taxilin-like isoform X1 [Sphaeramia orbicularis]
MEASVKAAEVLVPPQAEVAAPSLDSDDVVHAAAASSVTFDPMDEFRRRLDDIISGYGSAANGLLEKQRLVEAEMEKKMEEETREDTAVTMETEISCIMQSLHRLSTPEEKLKHLVQKHAEMVALRRQDEKKLSSLQQNFNLLLDERKHLQVEQCHSVAARSQLEVLCRDLQSHYNVLKAEAVQRCRDDEEKRNEITDHFQNMLKEIQDQIEQHDSRNQKLCHENTSLTNKLESLMSQCELREESLEKINRHRDLQLKLSEAKLQQANALLAEAEEKHKREKEYLLMEAIDKTKKCFALKEEELSMKKKLTLYSQKFDEFQETLAKSNEIYVRFKKEMDNMSEKMKKMDKESNLWKTRFENCNKALTDMIEERNERSQEYDLFVLKIQRLEKLCRALQDERKVLYDKIKDVRRSGTNIPSKLEGPSDPDGVPDKPYGLTEDEVQELEQLQKDDPVLTRDMARLKEEQAKLQEFAATLLDGPAEDEEDDDQERLDLEEDVVASAFAKFTSKAQNKEVSEQEDLKPEIQQEVKAVKTVSFSETLTTIEIPPVEEAKAEAEKVETQADVREDKPVETEKPKPEVEKAETQIQTKDQPEAELKSQKNPVITAEPENISPECPTAPKPETAEAKPVVPVKDEKTEPVQKPEEAAPESENTAKSTDTSKKQTPKKKKKRTGRV